MFGLQHGNVIVTNRVALRLGPGVSTVGLTLASLCITHRLFWARALRSSIRFDTMNLPNFLFSYVESWDKLRLNRPISSGLGSALERTLLQNEAQRADDLCPIQLQRQLLPLVQKHFNCRNTWVRSFSKLKPPKILYRTCCNYLLARSGSCRSCSMAVT